MSTPADTLPEAVREAAATWLVRRERGLTATEEQAYRAWLAADPRHAAAMARYESTWSALDRPRQGGATAAVKEKLEKYSRRRRRRRRLITSVTAFCALALTAYFWFRSPISELPSPTTGSAVVVRPETRTLSDGSVVELKEGGQFTVDFTPAFRRVALRQGEAHFQVTKDPARPFIVAAGGVEFRAVGTAFSVELGKGEVELLVTEGVVAVATQMADGRSELAGQKSEGGSHETGKPDLRSPNSHLPTTDESRLVTAGNRLTVDLSTATIHPTTAVTAEEASAALDWRSPRLEFSGVPLAQAVALMNQHSTAPGRPGVKLVIEDPAVGKEEVSGLFRADKIDTFVSVLENGFGLKAERRGEGEIVLRRVR